jgi:putative hydrolase of the HAD superfamily
MIKTVAFDLDDTLLDTSGLLIPTAAEKACLAMMGVGTSCTLEECLKLRKELSRIFSHPEIFGIIADTYEGGERNLALRAAMQEFYSPNIPESLPLMKDAAPLLDYLSTKYPLYLVTMGIRDTQARKIKALGIEKYFKKIFILDSFRGERKKDAFNEIIKLEGINPEALLSVGNRLSAEIRDAKLCGSQTCYYAYGEHVGEVPETPEDHPDFTIHLMNELVSTCKL